MDELFIKAGNKARIPDIEAVISFLTPEDGGRNRPCISGYRPAHLVKEDYLTSGIHHYFVKGQVLPGEIVSGTITFITPQAYPHCLWEGKILPIQEGRKIIGYAKVTKILNALLRAED